jgi:anaerobic magnesium-protoporphyrin IX monomethyl ester cyclase
MTDIFLVQPPIRDFYLTSKRTIPYGLASIASALVEHGFTVDLFDALARSKSRVLDLPQEMDYLRAFYGTPDQSPFALFHHFRHFGYSFEHIGKMAAASGAFLVGISSLFTAYSDLAMKTAEAIKAFHPGCKVVLGGHHPTSLPESCMACTAVDYLIRGEGEGAMPLLARAVKEGLAPDAVPGVVYRKTRKSLHVSPPAMVEKPEQFPLPALSLIKHSFYTRKKAGSTVIVTSRGCPMRCSYCSVGASGMPYRRRPVGSVIKEMEASVTRYNARFIDFEDENLSLDREWFLDLLKEIQKRFSGHGLELRAMNGLFPPSLDEKIICEMKTAGFKTLNLSLGSVSGPQLAEFARPDVRKALETALLHAGRFGLETVCYIIVSAPGQSADSSLKDLLFLAEKQTLAGVSVFYPSPGSPDFDKCDRLGLLPDRVSLMRATAFPISHTTSRLEAVTLLRLGRILNFIKSLKDHGLPLPKPAPCSGMEKADGSTRMEKGVKLLAGFLRDGRIRGITPEGRVYAHAASEKLTGQFISGLKHLGILK